MAIERYGSKTDVVVKLVLVFFVCLLSFSVGTYVGKKFSDNQHKLAEFEPTSKGNEHGRDVASVSDSHSSESDKKSDTLTDEEIAKLAEEFVSEEDAHAAPAAASHGNGHGEEKKQVNDKNTAHAEPSTHAAATAVKGHEKAHEAAPVAAAKPANTHEVTQAQAKNVERKIAATETAAKGVGGHEEKRPLLTGTAPAHSEPTVTLKKDPAAGKKPAIATSLPQELAASAVGKFTVQVASYTTEAEAKKMAETLREETFSSFYVPADVKDAKTNTTKTYYRVGVGLFETAKEADAYKKDLLERSKVKSAIVQKITK